MKKKIVLPGNGCYPYYAVRYRKDKLSDLLADRGVKRSDEVYLYTGQGDWDNTTSPEGFAGCLLPLVKAVFDLGAKPFLLSCGCLCYKDKKLEVARILAIPLVMRERRVEAAPVGNVSLIIARDHDPDDYAVVQDTLL